MKQKLPGRLTVELNCIYPRWSCYVTDDIGTANGGFWRGFKSHKAMFTWLAKVGYDWNATVVAER